MQVNFSVAEKVSDSPGTAILNEIVTSAYSLTWVVLTRISACLEMNAANSVLSDL